MTKKISLFLGVILLGFLLRFHNVANKELWYDEAFSAEIINNSYSELYSLAALDVHPPLYYFVLKLFSSIFGNSELSLRFPSIIFGVGLIVLVYYLVFYMTSSSKRALFAALIIATNPFLVIYSREARSYSMLAFLTVLTFLLLIRALRENKFLAVAIALPMLFLTHYISVFILLVFAIILLAHKKRTFFYLIPLAAVIIFWIPIIIGSSSSTGLDWIPKFTLVRVPESVHAFILGTDTNEPSVAPPLNPFPVNTTIVSLLIFVCVGIFVGLSKPSKEEMLLLICGVVPVILVAITSKYFGFNFYVERFMTGYGTLLLVYCVLLMPKFYALLPYVLLSIYLILSLKPLNIGYRELAEYEFDKPLVMTTANDFITAKYYVKDIKLQNGNWEQWVIIKPEDIYDIPSSENDFYLVSRKPIKKWKPALTMEEFYFYDWEE